MNYTEHLELNQWAADDFVLRQDFNADNQKLDAGYAGLQQQLTALTQLTQQGGKLCRVQSGTYTGNGSFPRRITLPFKPVLLFIGESGNVATLVRGSDYGPGMHDVSWGDNYVEWGRYDEQYNDEDTLYPYVALGYVEDAT